MCDVMRAVDGMAKDSNKIPGSNIENMTGDERVTIGLLNGDAEGSFINGSANQMDSDKNDSKYDETENDSSENFKADTVDSVENGNININEEDDIVSEEFVDTEEENVDETDAVQDSATEVAVEINAECNAEDALIDHQEMQEPDDPGSEEQQEHEESPVEADDEHKEVEREGVENEDEDIIDEEVLVETTELVDDETMDDDEIAMEAGSLKGDCAMDGEESLLHDDATDCDTMEVDEGTGREEAVNAGIFEGATMVTLDNIMLGDMNADDGDKENETSSCGPVEDDLDEPVEISDDECTEKEVESSISLTCQSDLKSLLAESDACIPESIECNDDLVTDNSEVSIPTNVTEAAAIKEEPPGESEHKSVTRQCQISDQAVCNEIKTEVTDMAVGPADGDLAAIVKKENEEAASRDASGENSDQNEVSASQSELTLQEKVTNIPSPANDKETGLPAGNTEDTLEEGKKKEMGGQERKRIAGDDLESEDRGTKKARLAETATDSNEGKDKSHNEAIDAENRSESNGSTSTGQEKHEKRALVDSDDEEADDPSPVPSPSNSSCPSRAPSPTLSSCPSRAASPGSPVSNLPPDIASQTATLRPALRVLRRGCLAKLTRSDLEELIVQKLCESITERSPEIGELRRRCQALEEEADRWKEKALSCQKQVRELDIVMQKFLVESTSNKNERQLITPIRVTRSVGLQVAIGFRRGPNASPLKPGAANVPPPPQNILKKPSLTPNKPPILNKLLKQSPNSPVNKVTSTTPTAAIIRPKGPNKVMPRNNQLIAPRPGANKTVRLPTTPSQRQQVSAGDSSVIDLTDDGPLTGGMQVVPSPGQKLAFVLPAAQGQPPKYLIATPTSVVRTPPPLYKANTPPRSPVARHPAQLPPTPANQPFHPSWKLKPPRPALRISNTAAGIVLSWDMALTADIDAIKSYQLYAYQEGASPPSPSLWRQVGDVGALPLPMACTLSCFVPGHRYHFSVRAVDVHTRVGPFSFPGSILLKK